MRRNPRFSADQWDFLHNIESHPVASSGRGGGHDSGEFWFDDAELLEHPGVHAGPKQSRNLAWSQFWNCKSGVPGRQRRSSIPVGRSHRYQLRCQFGVDQHGQRHGRLVYYLRCREEPLRLQLGRSPSGEFDPQPADGGDDAQLQLCLCDWLWDLHVISLLRGLLFVE